MNYKRSTSATDLPYDALDGWIGGLARFGFTTKGVVYVVIGVMAVRAALNVGGDTEGTRGALVEIGSQPFGQVLLALAAIGLFGYAVWRFIEAGVDPDRLGTDGAGLAKRGGYVVSGLVYLGLSIWAARIVLGSRSESSESENEWTAMLMEQPFGPWLVGAVGAAILGVGLYHFHKAYTAQFMRRYESGEMSSQQRRWARRMGRFGLVARGVTFCIIGGFLIQAAAQSDPSESKGLEGALQTLEQQPYGPWLLGIVAVGFVAYGVYCISRARFSTFSAQ